MITLSMFWLLLLLYCSSSSSSNASSVVSSLYLDYFQKCNESLPFCKYYHITISKLSYQSLSNNIDKLILENSRNRVKKEEATRIAFIGIESSDNQSITNLQVHKEIDLFLAERPYFDLAYIEPHYQGGDNVWIVIRLVPPNLHRLLASYSTFYFPSSQTCSRHPLHVELDSRSTWGNRYRSTLTHEERYKEAIYAIFIGDHCQHHSRQYNRFSSHKLCPHLVNKFECLFLPSTNCSLPRALIDCNKSVALKNDFYYFSRANENGALVQDIEKFRQSAQIKALPSIEKSWSAAGYNTRAIPPFKEFRSNKYEVVTAESSYSKNRSGFTYGDPRGDAYLFGVHYRPSFDFRTSMDKLIRHSRTSSHFGVLHPNDSCVAIHIRKDDRQIPHYNMKAWCINHTDSHAAKKEDRPAGVWNGKKVTYGVWMNYGCWYRVPYGDVSLEHYLNASLVLYPENTNIFIMTDDPQWLNEAAAQTLGIQKISAAHSLPEYEKKNKKAKRTVTNTAYENLRIFTLASKRADGDLEHRIDINAEFWASIELARQCKGLIFHAGSAASRFIAIAACYRSSNHYMQCPNIYDVSGGEIKR